MRVLITRPEPDAIRLAELLRAMGHDLVQAPLMRIDILPEAPPAEIASATLLFTSANGARAAKAHHVRSSRGALAVGEATAQAAQEAGFRIEGIAGGDVASLVELVANRLPKDQLLVHVAGSDVAGDLAGALSARGYRTLRWTAYAARAVQTLPAPAAAFLNGEPGAVLLYSPRSARLLTQLIRSAGIESQAVRHRAFCLSQAVADAAMAISWASLEVAAKPSQEALLNLLG
ncbi:MAG: uroporphyrinogen-III synthase [Alphaproteobacteria bacterium]